MILLSTDSLKWYWIHRILDFAKKSGFSWIDLSINYENFDTLDIEYLKKISDETWVKILSITAPSEKISENTIDKILAMAALFQTQVINFLPPHFSEKNINWYKEYLPKIKSSSSISIAIQNVEPKFLFFIIPTRRNASLMEIKKITWDTTFDLWNSSDIIKDYQFLANSIKNIYLSDTEIEKKWLMLWTSAWWTSFLPIESLLMKLKANSYNWFLTIKINPKELWAWNEDLVINNLKSCISYIEKYFWK